MTPPNVFDLVTNGDRTALREAIKVRPELLKENIKYNGRDIPILTWSLMKNQLAIFDELLAAGSSPVPVADVHQQPLYCAIMMRHHHAARLLIQCGASIELFYTSHTEFMMKEFLSEPDLSSYQLLIELGFGVKHWEERTEISLICLALDKIYDDTETQSIIARLISWGADVNHTTMTYYGLRSPLQTALKQGRFDLAEALLRYGADPALLDNSRQPLLHFLSDDVFSRDREAPDTLLRRLVPQNYDYNRIDQYGLAALHSAARNNSVALIEYLLKHGADINAKCRCGEKCGNTPLHVAIIANAKEAATTLIKSGADVTVANADNKTALDVGRKQPGFKRIVAALEKSSAHSSGHTKAQAGRDHAEHIIRGYLDRGEPWVDEFIQRIERGTEQQKTAWAALVKYSAETSSSKPSSRWFKQADKFLQHIGPTDARELMIACFALLKEKRTDELDEYTSVDGRYQYGGTAFAISDNNTLILRGLLWLGSRYADIEIAAALRTVAATMFKKVPGIGIRNAKVANAALQGLANMADGFGVKDVGMLRATTKYNPALVHINRVFEQLAKERGVSADELAQSAVPDYGLSGVGTLTREFGDFRAVLSVEGVGRTHVAWLNREGKEQKSVPANVKKKHAAAVKQLNALEKDLQAATRALSAQLEQSYLSADEISLQEWKEYHIDHKLAATLGRRLIWRLTHDTKTFDILYQPDGFVDCNGKPVTLPKQARVKLWHPTFSDVDEIERWRKTIWAHSITQPFKQAHREIYLLTDAERAAGTQSPRFASHIIRQHQFHALATQRGWAQTRGGSWDGGQETDATRYLRAHQLYVKFATYPVEELGGTSIHDYLSTKYITFARDAYGSDPLPLDNVDALVFSEIMRDVDLFVSVTSVGNDPDWEHRDGYQRYFDDYGFGDLSQSAQTRKDVLELIVPKLKIAPQLRIDGRFLIVTGKRRTYKIHLGSANILMEPDNRYLCIVPKSDSMEPVYLPFEGDARLSVILSKAVMLADDSKIKDKTILSQIGRGADEALA